MNEEKPLIELIGASKTYYRGDVEIPAMKNVNLAVERGGFVAIMGASGSGKSTLMNIIGCLDRPTGGRYLLEGREVGGLSRNELAEIRNKKIGFVFQNFNLLPRTTATENVELPLLYAGVSGKERRRRALAAIEQVGVLSRADHHTNQMSGGQQQRVAIARAIVTNPGVIMADEPTGNLDSRSSVEIMAIFQRLGASGITIILVTHEPDIAAFASRVVTMRDGEIVSEKRQDPLSAEAAAAAMAAARKES